MTLTRQSRFLHTLALGATALGSAACNDHPLEPLDKVVSAANNTAVSLPAKTKLDFLFLIDNSGSMCEEQANLAANFGLLSGFLFDDLGDSADYRIAVINTDLRTASARGRFQDTPPGISPNCPAAIAAEAENCTDLLNDAGSWTFGPILKSGLPNLGGNIGATRDEFEHKFRCLATLGTGGDGFEKGLESMRLALSCEGPNKPSFAECCVDEVNAAGQVVKSTYDRNCAQRLQPGQEPDFLRPDAILVVINLSDEVDCSDPQSNPKASRRAICKYGPMDGPDGDSFPDGFQDPTLCPSGDIAACYNNECSSLTPDKCYQARCQIDRGDNNNCEWFPDALTPVGDYVDFLRSLKVDPNRAVIVASIVGNRAFVQDEAGQTFEVSNVQGRPEEACWYWEDHDSNPETPERPNANVSNVDSMCCPEGKCKGGPVPTCSSSNGKAYSGRRYLQLAEAFGINGIGCPAGSEGTLDCISICEDDFSRPLQIIRDRIVQVLGHYCLEKVPQCLAPGEADEPLHPCETPAEFAEVANYKPTVNVRMQCTRTQDQGGACEVQIPPTTIPQNGFNIELDPTCPSQLALTLTDPPPAGAEIFLQFRVEVSDNAGFAVDSGVAEPTGDAGEIILPGDGGIIVAPDAGQVILPDAGQVILPDAGN